MMQRFHFPSPLIVSLLVSAVFRMADAEVPLIQSIEVQTPFAAPDDDTYWMRARAGIIPAVDGAEPSAVVAAKRIGDAIGS
jgi:hypothetical protein